MHENKPFIIKEKATSAVKLCLAVGIGASAGLFCILEPMNIMLFQNSEGTQTLQIFSLCPAPCRIAAAVSAIEAKKIDKLNICKVCVPSLFWKSMIFIGSKMQKSFQTGRRAMPRNS